jgi:hypothetical protein
LILNQIDPISQDNLEDEQKLNSDQNVSSRTRTALIVCAVLSLLLVGVIAYVKDQESNVGIADLESVTSSSLIGIDVPFQQISIAGLNNLDIDSDERLNNVLKQFEIPAIEPGAVVLSELTSSSSELFVSTFEFAPVCEGVISLTGLLGLSSTSIPKVIFSQKNGNYSATKSDPKVGFSYSISIIDSSGNPDQLEVVAKSIPSLSCNWKNSIISPSDEDFSSCALETKPWINTDCLTGRKPVDTNNQHFFNTEYSTEDNFTSLAATTQLVTNTSTNFKTVTVRKLLKIKGAYEAYLEISIELNSIRKIDSQLATKLAADEVFRVFEGVVLDKVLNNPQIVAGGEVVIGGANPGSAVVVPKSSVASAAPVTNCASQWDRAHTETLAGGNSDSELRKTISYCSSISEWTREAKRVGEYSTYLLATICVLVSNPPSEFCS